MGGWRTGDALVLGPATLDRYTATGEIVPGGPALNVAWHWTQLGRRFQLLSRIGDDGDVVVDWLGHHRIDATAGLRRAGRTCSIDVAFGPDRQPTMTGFDPGVWEGFSLTEDERDRMDAACATHAVLTEAVIDELESLAADGRRPSLSADFLTSSHVSEARFAGLLSQLDIGFVGWPGRPDDRRVAEMSAMADDVGAVLVVTFGSDGIRVIDGRSGHDRWFDIAAVRVEGTTVGCGDAFISGFLHRWLDDRDDVEDAVAAGAARGAAATAWQRALPPGAYDVAD